MTDERRQHSRFRLWLPARIEGGGNPVPVLAVGHDMSQSGSFFVTRSKLAVGSHIKVHLRIPPDADEEQVLTGTVLRCSSNEADPDSLYPFQVAVAFDETDPELEQRLREQLAVLEGIADP